MTIDQLSEYRDLLNEIRGSEQELEKLKKSAYGISSPKMTDEAASHGAQESRQDRYVPGIADIERVIKTKRTQSISARYRIERYIASVPNCYIRRIMEFRFVSGLSWRAVAHRMGGGNTESGVRMAVTRFVEKEKSRG